MIIERTTAPEADATNGNSAAPAPAPEHQNEPQAQAAPAITREDLRAITSEIRDGLFAELRKSGVFDQKKSKAAPSADPTSTQNTAQPDPIKLRSLDRALAKTGLASRLSDSQYQRAEKMFVAEDPADVDAWVKDVFDGYGVAPPATATAQPTPAPKPQNAQPASDRGSPPPSQVPLYEADLMTMSDSDRTALTREKGPRWFRDQLAKQLKGRPMRIGS